MADIAIKGRCTGCGTSLIYDVITGTKPQPELRAPTGCVAYADGHLCEGCTGAVESLFAGRKQARTGRAPRGVRATDAPSSDFDQPEPTVFPPAPKVKASAKKEGS